jgi:hypothetical protein
MAMHADVHRCPAHQRDGRCALRAKAVEQIQPADRTAALHGILPDSRVDRTALPRDVAGNSDVY